MNGRLHSCLLLALIVILGPIHAASADEASFVEGVSDGLGQGGPPETSSFEFAGHFRSRGEMLYNLDLDRGLSPTGQSLFPVPLGDGDGQALTGANMRLRSDLRFRAPSSGLSAVVRADLLDNLSLGSTPDLQGGSPAGSTTQISPTQVLRIKRAYGEVLLPVGMLTVGRQGSHWGLGMLSNGGDCEDCDSGDAADRIAFVTPLVGHLFAAAYDISATGPSVQNGTRSVDAEPTDDVQNLTFAVMRYHTPLARDRRSRAGMTTIEYGAYLSQRWQDTDIPASYLIERMEFGPDDVSHRGYSATAADLWFRLSTRRLRLELEAAWLGAEVVNPSLVPGVEYYQRATSSQFAAAMQSELSLAALHIGFDAGFASGDPSPGFGARPGTRPAETGDLDGVQADLPFDNRIDNFRFHSDYRIDRILFREIIGTVTDAVYLRPHLQWALAEGRAARLLFQAALIASWAVQPASTPSGQRPLGLELDPGLRYETNAGFVAALDYALLLPLSGLDNPEAGLEATTAQLLRLNLSFGF